MNIDLTGCETSAQAVTKICYNEPTRNLDFRIKCENLDDLKKCVDIISEYNDFRAERVNRALEDHTNTLVHSPFNDEITNPAFEYEIAREGSVAIYIKETWSQVKDMEERMRLIKDETKADEMTIETTGMGRAEARFWWD
jgi:hypothetical protein